MYSDELLNHQELQPLIKKFKKKFPKIDTELSYNDLEIKEGGTASNTFLSMVNGKYEGDTEDLGEQLLEYCKRDTLAMVKIVERLLSV